MPRLASAEHVEEGAGQLFHARRNAGVAEGMTGIGDEGVDDCEGVETR